jgi:glutamine---fructose-6-phosphate transaminase (isomerizing)
MPGMLEESLEAPERVADQLARDRELYAALGGRLRAAPPPAAVTIARGSSDHAAAYGAYLLTLAAGVPVASLPPSLVTLGRAPLRLPGHLALAVSQSGRSPDLVACLGAARGAGALGAALVNEEGSPLAAAAELVLPLRAGPERGVAATKSLIASLAALARLAAAWRPDPALDVGLAGLPGALRRAAGAGLAADAGWLDGAEHVYVLARGPGQPVALEVALKLKETCGVHAEAFSSAELRHGPREIVDERFAVLALALPGPGLDDVLAAAGELAGQGARARLVGPPEAAGDGALVRLPDGLEWRLAPIAAAQALYPLLARTAAARGRDPDRPRTLAKVTETF